MGKNQKYFNLKVFYGFAFLIDASAWFYFLPVWVGIPSPTVGTYILWQVLGIAFTFAAYELTVNLLKLTHKHHLPSIFHKSH